MGFLGLAISALLNNTLIQLKDELVDFGIDNWEKFETGFNESFTSYFEGSFKRVKNIPFVLSGTNNIDLLSIFQPTYLKSEISHVNPPYYRGCWHGVSRCLFTRFSICIFGVRVSASKI